MLLNYAKFLKEYKLLKHLGRVYAQGLQCHPARLGYELRRQASSTEDM